MRCAEFRAPTRCVHCGNQIPDARLEALPAVACELRRQGTQAEVRWSCCAAGTYGFSISSWRKFARRQRHGDHSVAIAAFGAAVIDCRSGSDRCWV